MYWANFLHIYQPVNQKPHWVKKIANESYRRLTRGLLKNPRARLTLNVNGILLDLFKRDGCLDIIADLKKLARRGQIEFTNTAKYHPFLPLLPTEEIIRQIKLNEQTNKKYFGNLFKPTGFFPPEMAYNRKIAEVAKKMGFKWMILEELAYNGRLGSLAHNTIYTIKGLNGLEVYFRDRATSFRILSAQIGVGFLTSQMLVDLMGPRIKKKEYLITAVDGETFGHHRPGLEKLLFDLYEVPGLTSLKISELSKIFTGREEVEPLPSTWALMKKDLERDTPYSRWKNDDNEIQTKQWQLTFLAISTVKKLKKTASNYQRARGALDRALQSDQYWWASAQPWWSIEMIEGGAKALKDVIINNPTATPKEKSQAEKIYREILYTAFDWQRSGKVDVLSREADEDVTQRITTEMPYIPKNEFNKIVGNLEKQMLEAAKNLEYERASQIRDRVTELKDKKDQITRK